MLLLRVLPTRAGFLRPIDLVILPVGAIVAFVVVVPILIATMASGYAVGFLLSELGAPDVVFSAVVLVIGVGGAVVLSFFVLLRISRRLPPSTRAVVFDEDEVEGHPAPRRDRDPDADAAMLAHELQQADAALAPPDESQLSGPR